MAAPRRVNPVEATLRRIAEHLTKAGTPWALIGGLAVSARAEPRTTRDVDVAVAVAGDAEAEALVDALQGSGYTVVAALEQTALQRLSTIRLSSRLDWGRRCSRRPPVRLVRERDRLWTRSTRSCTS